MEKMDFSKYGPWAFYVALFVALLLAMPFIPTGTWAIWLLAVLGLIVGLLNISKKETQQFLLASLVWMVAGEFLQVIMGTIPVVGDYIARFLGNVVTFVGPAAAVVAVMALFYITRD